MIKELKNLIRDQYGWQNKVRVCEMIMLSMGVRYFCAKPYLFVRRVRDMYIQ